MSFIGSWKPRMFGLIVVTLATAFAMAFVQDASAQRYYYQAAPGYYHNDTVTGTVAGGALGAVTGAIVGGSKNRGEGALIGAGVGAITGNLLGQSQDRADERQAAAGAAVAARASQQAAAMAVTNYDLVGMSRAGVNDDLIISTIRTRGAQLDLSPQALISLKQNGVSDRVVLAAQQMGGGPAYASAPPTILTEVPPPTTVILAPDPFYRTYYYHPHYHYPHYHSRVHVHGHF